MSKPDHPFVKLTDRQFEILSIMAKEDEELVCEGRICYVGLIRTNWRTAKALLLYCLISGWQTDKVGMQYLSINESGRAYLNGERKIYPVSTGNGKTRMSEKIPLPIYW